MSQSELQFLANHLGHDVSTHKGHYRLHASAVEITKVGKLLMEIDRNDARFVGKTTSALLHDTGN